MGSWRMGFGNSCWNGGIGKGYWKGGWFVKPC
jgi:hypothetical protein